MQAEFSGHCNEKHVRGTKNDGPRPDAYVGADQGRPTVANAQTGFRQEKASCQTTQAEFHGHCSENTFLAREAAAM
jgi:hypothetical protein